MGLGRQVDKIPHSCGTKHALTVFAQDDGTVDGWCYRCGVFVRHPYGEERLVKDLPPKKERSPEEIAAEIAEIDGYPTVSVEQRKLRNTTLEEFGAKTSLSEEDGKTPTAIYWPVKKDGKLTGYHAKVLNPAPGHTKAFNIGDVKDCDLLGWDKAKTSGAYRLIITEGPEDMASTYTIHKLYGDPEYMPAVCSLPHGASSAKHYIQKHSADIRKKFKEVVFCFDDDEAGHKATKEALLAYPTALSVTLPYKDANECLIQGAGKAAYKKFRFDAQSPKNTSLVFAANLHLGAREPAKYGELTWPFAKLNDLTRGIRYGETHYIGAGVKMGKSELRDEMAAHFIREHNSKVFMASFEEGIKKTYRKIAGKTVSKQFNDPKKDFDFEAYDKAGDVLHDKLALLDVYQRANQDAFKYDIISAAEWGAKSIFVDPITNFTNGIDAAQSNTILQGMSQELATLARDTDTAIFIFCHLKEPEGNISKDARAAYYKQQKFIGLGNCPHEMGGDVMSAQFAGSRGMMRSCNYMIAIEGNKDPELDEDTRNIRNIKICEDREFGEAGIIPVYWNKNTARFQEL
jgi:twinkle protein